MSFFIYFRELFPSFAIRSRIILCLSFFFVWNGGFSLIALSISSFTLLLSLSWEYWLIVLTTFVLNYRLYFTLRRPLSFHSILVCFSRFRFFSLWSFCTLSSSLILLCSCTWALNLLSLIQMRLRSSMIVSFYFMIPTCNYIRYFRVGLSCLRSLNLRLFEFFLLGWSSSSLLCKILSLWNFFFLF